MNPELEALIKAYDAAIQSQGRDSEQLEAIYESLLAQARERHRNVSLDTLDRTVQLAHRRWVKAQANFPTLPSQAWGNPIDALISGLLIQDSGSIRTCAL